jgi:predicted nucleic acid-binding protein
MRLFWDTNLVIYLWETGPLTKTTRAYANWLIENNHQLITSSLTVGEILVHPMQSGDTQRIQAYITAFNALEVIPFDTTTAQHFSRLRAENKNLRPPDAIQLACAIRGEADTFVTNDTRLHQISTRSQLKLQALSEWAKT